MTFGCSALQAGEMEKREDCEWIENPANDADSFHVRWHNREYIFRLYYVDAPETDDRFPERLKEQADYFKGMEQAQLLQVGKAAAAYTRELLKDKKFTVYTNLDKALGASDKPRYYAMIEVEGRFLSELLVEKGYARLHGNWGEPPGPLTERRFYLRLKGLEKEAQDAMAGGWAVGGVPASIYPFEVITTQNVPIFNTQPPHQFIGTYAANFPITITGTAHANFVKVSFSRPGGITVEGLADRTALPQPANPPPP